MLKTMADVFSKKKRSQVMAAIRSYGNKNTELKFVSILLAHGITGWRRQQQIIGKPDFVFRNHRLAVFVDGCFWHGCLKHFRKPKDNQKFWLKKILGNQKRDRFVTATLKRAGWRVLRIWEHELQNEEKVASKVAKLLANGKKGRPVSHQ